MPDGELRRPPQLWEQRLARTTSILGVGISSSGDATSIVTPTPPPGAGGGTEPAPVLPPPGDFIKPSTPQLIGAVQGINVLWDGLNDNGDLWPYDTSYIEVHMDTSGTAFTPGTATLQGRLARPGGLYVGGLAAGTTYYFRLRGADPAGNVTDPSDAASGLTGLTTASDYGTATIGSGAVSFDARAIGGITTTVGTSQPSSPNIGDIWLDTSGGNTTHKRWDGSSWVTQAWSTSSIGANVITATQIAAGAVTAGAIAAGAITAEKIQAGAVTTDKLTAGTITGFYISGGTVNGGFISGGTVVGTRFETRSGNTFIRIDDQVAAPYGTNDAIEFYDGGVQKAILTWDQSDAMFDIYAPYIGVYSLTGGTTTFDVSGKVEANDIVVEDISVTDVAEFGFSSGSRAVRVASTGEVFSYGIDNNTTANAANVRVGSSAQLLKSTSTVRLKDELAPLDEDLVGVPPEKLSQDPPSVDPYDVLTLTPTEFRSLSPADADARALGFIAEDVAAKFPWAANWDDEGLPSAIEDRPIIAALVAVIKDLRSRIEALEA